MKAFLKMPTSLREVIAQARLPTLSTKQRNAEPTDEDEDAIALLPDEEKDEPLPNRTPANLLNGRSRLFWLVLALIGVALLAVALLLPSRKRPPPEPAPPEEPPHQTDYYFHIVLPTTQSSANFCKTLLSAAVLNLPTPWLINWDWNGDATEDPTLLKLRTTTEWLERMPPEREDDPVAIVGNVNAWFQVRSDVLLSRYHKIRRRGDRQIEELFSNKVGGTQGLETKIVFSSEKDCQLTAENQSGCLAAAAEDGSLHYLSTNIVMGPLRDIRSLWQRARQEAERLAESESVIDENRIFAQILGEQEMRRGTMRKSEADETPEEREEDFGIMLDFGRELAYAADEKLEGVDWVKHNGEGDKRLSVPDDIAISTPPFWTFEASGALPNTPWSEVPLLAGVHANIVPALVQRGRKADKELSSTWFEKMWFQPYGRQLLDAFALIPSAPLAVLIDDEGNQQRYWSPHLEKVGAKDQDLVFHDWTELCATEQFKEDVAREVFLDGKGVWEDSRP
ncbi:hypothetical protein M409DRAFT_27170 [Zasmidium cellare ATCC 36951]|uniref:Uncharacterized protein n=1 Tax=Zasmidium cellare ATCC 36951 TaxID=1080233 RepID=A0A6A6C8G6_ZASCE|nr:uncharacterized protein M409DRAFT_27170 [Zasmidium cellare ATCC 36951]KAF2162548.1 hypothetical protein M409DRAFT_27170 [Zasmidium cellare ATCC 36951]